jgi:hypothetical protein
MSKIIASAAIRGSHAIHDRVAKRLAEALEKHGEGQEIEFPNTAYYLPIIYAMTGEKVARLGDCPGVMKIAEDLLPPVPTENLWTPYLGPGLDAGMATLFMEEIEEAVAAARQASASQIALLKCTSAYPAPPDEMNLRTLPHLAETFGVPVGVSDHTLGIAVPVAAVAPLLARLRE